MSEPTRAQTERNMLPKVGASFYRDDEGQLMFQFVVDTANVIGPRPANRGDQEKHAGAWAAFCAAEGVSALDRDGREGTGGSLPQESPAAPVQAPVEPVFKRYDGYEKLNILPEEPVAAALHVPPGFDEAQVSPITADDLGGGEFVTRDGASFQSLGEAAEHVKATAEPKAKRKYTRRSKG